MNTHKHSNPVQPPGTLRERMTGDLQLRGLSPRTQEAYLHAVRQLAAFYRRPPDQLNEDQVRDMVPQRRRMLAITQTDWLGDVLPTPESPWCGSNTVQASTASMNRAS